MFDNYYEIEKMMQIRVQEELQRAKQDRLAAGVEKSPVNKRRLLISIIYIVLFLLLLKVGGPFLVSCSKTASCNVVGIWQGSLNASGIEYPIVIKITGKQDRSLTATMDNFYQRMKGIPVDEIAFKEGNLSLRIKSVLLEGRLSKDGLSIDGQWKQGGQSLPIMLLRVDKAPELNRPQEPVKPYPYREEQVIYRNEQAGIRIAGTLTMPLMEAPFPAVLLISGSGGQDRDSTELGHKPFLVLSDYLTRLGIAVLRVDDRGVGESTGDFAQVTSGDFAGDVLAGVEYLKSREDINPKKIGLIGHSEGGIIAPMVAAQSPDVAFIVMMAGTGLNGEEILYLQGALLARANGAKDDTIAKLRLLQERIYTLLKQETDDEAAAEKLRVILENAQLQLGEEEKQKMLFSAYMKIINIIPWYRHLLISDPKPTLMKVQCPVLAINGDKDLQVPSEENLHAIEEALKAGGNKDYTVKELPDLNHLFQTAETGALSEYGKIEETISPSALDAIADWVLEQTR